MNFSELVEFGPCFSAETVKACALIDLHMTAVKMPFGQTGILLLTWEKCGSMAAQQGPVWSDDGLEEERGEDTSSVEYYEHNVDNLAIEVVGQSEVITLFLDIREVGPVALSCHLSMDLLCQEMRDACVGELRVSGFCSLLVFGVPGKKEKVF